MLYEVITFLRGKIGKKLDSVLSYGKYAAAAVALYLFYAAHNPRWAVRNNFV